MGLFTHLLGLDGETAHPDLLPAIDRAVSLVEPLLKQAGGYPENYREPVATALEHARALANAVPGPVSIDREAYARDPLVHALFPSADFIHEALCASQAMWDYRRDCPIAAEVYALMGMRRCEKVVMGMELAGEVVRREVPQHVVYFTSHTIDNPAPNEEQSRQQIAWSLFDKLAAKVAQRIDRRKQAKQEQMQQKDLLMARLHTAGADHKAALELELHATLEGLQAMVDSLELHHYLADFNAVMLNPGPHLHIEPTSMILDSMGIRRDAGQESEGRPVVFSELIGFDRRDWTVTLIHCTNLRDESTFAERLESAYRKLAI